MNSRFHLLVRTAAASALAAGAIAAFGAPARAADNVADLELKITGTKVAATSSGKFVKATIKNHGPNTAVDTIIYFANEDLDGEKVQLEVPDAESCENEGKSFVCIVGDIPSGASLDLPIKLTRKGGTGSAGKLFAAVAHEGIDDNEGNDVTARGVDVQVGVSGPDLYAVAADVASDDNGGKKLVAPGSVAELTFEVGNQGDVAVEGFHFDIQLPKHVSFAEELEGCTYDAAKTVATCTYDELPLVPGDQDQVEDDEIFSAVAGTTDIKVAADAPSPKDLTGTVKVKAIIGAAVVEGPVASQAVTELPEGIVGEKAEEGPVEQAPPARTVKPGSTVPEVDKSDNTDQFVVFVGKTGGAGGSDNAAGGKNNAGGNPAGGAGGAGELAVTGMQTALVGGVGVAVVAVGGLLLLSARRRRVVLVTPGDETSAR
ncbi:hypothetical protein [Couchioplanes azureus]|uniref:hypothetical protein n=1 Tax=Couchioplanes caeruleus TaxID=56438 RepID=UPI00166F817E|nr:hypothetical protein [Couchioplanes caeruleus]GGQ38941.1 hypothetical protein GCM10010166_01830 [Couchioplanes caeruleus subsp. azureus]